MRDAHREDLSIQSLLPYMTKRKFAAGDTLVRKGEKADRLYYLVAGSQSQSWHRSLSHRIGYWFGKRGTRYACPLWVDKDAFTLAYHLARGIIRYHENAGLHTFRQPSH
jgi:hypothetical protein